MFFLGFDISAPSSLYIKT